MNNNEKLRELLALPPIQTSASTALVVPQMPPQQVVTGDREVDAVLWLQAVIATGDSDLIDKALESAKAITTPMKELGLRYGQHLARTHGALGAAFGSMGFGELEDQAKRAKEKAARRHDALSRFGDEKTLFADTAAEKACKAALRGLKQQEYPYFDPAAAAKRFGAREALRPHTLDDCLYAMEHWDKIDWLRSAWENSGDPWRQVQAHDDYCFAMLANIKPRSQEEAIRALEYLDDDRMDRNEAPAILRNLVVSGWSRNSNERDEPQDESNEERT